MTKDMTDAVIALADALARENEALVQGDVTRVATMVSAKRAALAALFEVRKHRIACVRDHRTQERVDAVRQRLETLADENRWLLEHAIKVQTRVIDVLTGIVRRNERASYEADGTLSRRTSLTTGFSARA